MTTNMIIRFRIVYSKKTEISVGTTYSGSVFCGSDSRGRLDFCGIIAKTDENKKNVTLPRNRLKYQCTKGVREGKC